VRKPFLDTVFSLGGHIRVLTGWGVAIKAVFVLLGWAVSWAAVVAFWDSMPLLWWKVPAIAGISGLFFILSAWAYDSWRSTPSLPDPFYEDLRQLGRHFRVFAAVLSPLYENFAEATRREEGVWGKVVGKDGAGFDEFGKRVYAPGDDTTAKGFWDRCNIKNSIGKRKFREFDNARSDIAAFIGRWHPVIRRNRRAREQAIEYLANNSTANLLTVLEPIEDALCEALGNTTVEDVGWRWVIALINEQVAEQNRRLSRP